MALIFLSGKSLFELSSKLTRRIYLQLSTVAVKLLALYESIYRKSWVSSLKATTWNEAVGTDVKIIRDDILSEFQELKKN